MATTSTDDFTSRMFEAINGMLLDMLAAVARKDYDDSYRSVMERREPPDAAAQRLRGGQASRASGLAAALWPHPVQDFPRCEKQNNASKYECEKDRNHGAWSAQEKVVDTLPPPLPQSGDLANGGTGETSFAAVTSETRASNVCTPTPR